MWQFFCATVTSCLHLLLVDQKTSQKMYVYICIYIYMYIGIISYPHYGLVNVGYIPTIFASKSWFGAVFWWFFWWPGSTSWWPGGSVMWCSNIRLTRMACTKKKLSFEGSLTGITNFKGPILIPSGRDHPIIVSNVALNPPQYYPRSTCLDHVPISTWKCPFGTELFLLGILMRSLKADLKRRSKKSRPCLSATLW